MKKLVYRIASMGTAALAAAGARKGMRKGWRRVLGSKAPKKSSSSAGWRAVIAWGALMGAVAGVARLASRRGVDKAWEAAADEDPPE